MRIDAAQASGEAARAPGIEHDLPIALGLAVLWAIWLVTVLTIP
jgi:hypothetical protein